MEVVDIEKFYFPAHQHAKEPRNLGPPETFNGHAKITGPCGDTMEFWLWVDQDKIRKVSFLTDGCAPSLAAGSMTTCLAEEKTIAEAKALLQKDVLDALGGLPKDHEHCALLAANTLAAACDNYLENFKTGGKKESGQ